MLKEMELTEILSLVSSHLCTDMRINERCPKDALYTPERYLIYAWEIFLTHAWEISLKMISVRNTWKKA